MLDAANVHFSHVNLFCDWWSHLLRLQCCESGNTIIIPLCIAASKLQNTSGTKHLSESLFFAPTCHTHEYQCILCFQKYLIFLSIKIFRCCSDIVDDICSVSPSIWSGTFGITNQYPPFSPLDSTEHLLQCWIGGGRQIFLCSSLSSAYLVPRLINYSIYGVPLSLIFPSAAGSPFQLWKMAYILSMIPVHAFGSVKP